MNSIITKDQKNINDIKFLVAKILRRIPLNNNLKVKFNSYRHQWVERKINSLLNEAYSMVNSKLEVNKKQKNGGPIWVFWWQGIDGMPDLVKKCYFSVLRNANGNRVILITKSNFQNYTDISPTIIRKLLMGKMTVTHFSDILRFNLLKNNGGLWLDATIFVNKPIPEKYFTPIFTCSGFPDKDYFFVTRGKWTGFLFGGCKKSKLFQFMDDFFKLYWEKNNILVDYFLIDYALEYAWMKNLSCFKYYTQQSIGKNNSNLFELYPLLNKKYDSKLMYRISKDTEMYKLSYRLKLDEKTTTFYGVLVK